MAASPQVFELPDHGTLTLLMPDGWAGEMAPPRSQSPPTHYGGAEERSEIRGIHYGDAARRGGQDA